VFGDFNLVRRLDERRDPRNNLMGGRELEEFDEFIYDMELEEVYVIHN